MAAAESPPGAIPIRSPLGFHVRRPYGPSAGLGHAAVRLCHPSFTGNEELRRGWSAIGQLGEVKMPSGEAAQRSGESRQAGLVPPRGDRSPRRVPEPEGTWAKAPRENLGADGPGAPIDHYPR